MNTRAATHLREIAHHARAIANQLESGGFDDDGELALASELDHLLYHLTLAWHESKMTDEEMDRLTPEQATKLGASIPKFDDDYALVDL
jgi:hypothetical protein